MLKQIVYPKSYHCPRGQEEDNDYLRDVALVTKVFDIPDEFGLSAGYTPRGVEIRPKSKITVSPDFTGLDSRVQRYLEQNNTLPPLISEALKPLKRYFVGATYEFDLLEEGGKEKLFIKILTTLTAEEALTHLDVFDKSWWFKQSKTARRQLEFVLEFM